MNENRTQERGENRQQFQNRDNRGDNRGQNPQQGKPQQQQPEGPKVRVTEKYVSYGQYGQVSREVFDRCFQRMVRWEKRTKGVFDGISRFVNVLERLWITFCVTTCVGFLVWGTFKVVDLYENGVTWDGVVQTTIVMGLGLGTPLMCQRVLGWINWLRGGK